LQGGLARRIFHVAVAFGGTNIDLGVARRLRVRGSSAEMSAAAFPFRGSLALRWHSNRGVQLTDKTIMSKFWRKSARFGPAVVCIWPVAVDADMRFVATACITHREVVWSQHGLEPFSFSLDDCVASRTRVGPSSDVGVRAAASWHLIGASLCHFRLEGEPLENLSAHRLTLTSRRC